MKCIRTIILQKAGFTEDALACFGGDKEYGVYAINRNLVKAVFRGFLPEEIDDNNYRSTNPWIEQKKRELRTFWVEVLRVLLRTREFEVVLSGNFSYAAEQEFAGALSKLGVAFVAIHKECLKTPGLVGFYRDIYAKRKNAFQGAKICMYNKVEAEIQRAAKVTVADDIVVTGMPRLDRLHRLREQGVAGANGRPSVLFFSFNEKTGLPILGRKIKERFEKLERDLERLNFVKLTGSCHKAMVELARQHPDLHVFIKTKGDVQSIKTLHRFLGKDFIPPENLEIVAGGDPLNILVESRVVCGFNSTVLFEALALNKPVVVPMFHEALQEEIAPYLVDFENAVKYARSPSELIEMLYKRALLGATKDQGPELNESKRRLLDKWVGNPDGGAGRRVRAVVTEIVKSRAGSSDHLLRDAKGPAQNEKAGPLRL